MADKSVAIVVRYMCIDTATGLGKTGDVSNHTLRWCQNTTSNAPTNTAQEVDATNTPGLYKILITSTETNCTSGTLAGKSSTSGCVIVPTHIAFSVPVPSSTLGDYKADVSTLATATNLAEAKTVVDAIKIKSDLIPANPAAVGDKMRTFAKIASTTGNWATTGTWSDGSVPAAGDNIIINSGVTVTVDANLDLSQFGTISLVGSAALKISASVTVAKLPLGWIVAANYGTITTNYGAITTNSGSVSTNNGAITTNSGTITTNYGTVASNDSGTVVVNYGTITVNKSGSLITANLEPGVVSINVGTISANYGSVTENFATVSSNDTTGMVTNYESGVVTTNNATVNPAMMWVDTSVLAATVGEVAEKTEQLTFVGDRVKSIAPPSAALVSGPDVFMFNLIADEADPAIDDESTSDNAPGVLVDDVWVTTHNYTAPTVHTQWQVSIDVTQSDPEYESLGDPEITLSSSDESIATVDASGKVSYVADGTCKIIGTSAAIGESPSQCSDVQITNTTYSPEEIVSYSYVDDPGSVRENAVAAVDSRIAVDGVEKALFSSRSHTIPVYVRNTNCWAADLDLTCLAVWNSVSGDYKAGTMISPRHIIFAAHYPLEVGSSLRFVDGSNNIITRTMTTSMRVGSTDFMVGLLDSDVTGCSAVKVLPDDWADYIPNQGLKIPALGTDPEKNALVRDVSSIDYLNATGFRVPQSERRLDFYETIVSGDSGHPSFLIINDQLVLLTLWKLGGTGSGFSVTHYKADIESVMTSLGGGYSTLTEIDLSTFNTYGA